ncbi:hypothetical protein G6F50_015185 [Rhizopus delemar]|uniref:Uncharacterized protein n=1 Tax=Rhizopus delemar TaxID=936053 RepID=A0A9P6XZF3_9FUNG|nr:hypothetical protein G6F50_015185 [Rhizopus delemar]
MISPSSLPTGTPGQSFRNATSPYKGQLSISRPAARGRSRNGSGWPGWACRRPPARAGLRPPPAPVGCRPPGGAVAQHRHQGLPQAAPERAHASALAGCAASGVRAKAIRRRPPMPPATTDISSSVANGHSETSSGEPMNCCWVCSLM